MIKTKFWLCFHFLLANMIVLGISNAQEVSTDYTPATKALNYLNNIRSNYNMYKQRVEKNLSLEYTKCINSITNLKCQNIDQWQSVIEELKLEINNSESTEVPFLTDRKEKKVSELEALLNRSNIDNDNFTQLSEKLREHQQRVINKMYYIQSMYKLNFQLPKMQAFIQEGPVEEKPESKDAETEETEEKEDEEEDNNKTDVAADLNADVPDIAKQQLGQAKNDYELADLSIQAQTTANMLRNYGQKCSETLEHLEQSYQGRLEDIMQKKLKLKEDILKVRQMLINENKIKEKNKQKISEMETKIKNCQGKPTNIEKDCEPLRVNGNKILTEIDIVNARTLLLHKEVSKLLLENYTPEELKQIFSEQAPKPQPVDENSFYLNEPTEKKKKENVQYEPREPQELYPIYHYKDQIKPKDKKSDNQEETASEEEPTEETNTEEAPPEEAPQEGETEEAPKEDETKEPAESTEEQE